MLSGALVLLKQKHANPIFTKKGPLCANLARKKGYVSKKQTSGFKKSPLVWSRLGCFYLSKNNQAV
jgi:hypothetical protein